jgi:proline dehydrogenase
LLKELYIVILPARKENEVGLFTFLAKRFIAGETKEEAFEAVRKLNKMGMKTTLDILGENVNSSEMATNLANLYIDLIKSINKEKVGANVSVKLTQMGLDVSDQFCFENVSRIIETAKANNSFVRIDMEGSPYTERTLQLVYRWAEKYDNIGTVIQAMMLRSENDIKELNKRKIKVRLCKGAYKEPVSVSFQKKDDVNANYIKLMKMLLDSGNFHGIATHDDAMITATKEYAAKNGITKDKFEFQMLYGINRGGQMGLVKEGYGMLVYVPFGDHWFPYYYRRLRERKENVLFIAKHLFKN